MGRTYGLGVTGIPHVRPGATRDFEAILEIRDQVSVDLLRRGVQWNPNLLTEAHLADWTDSGTLFVAEIKNEIVGSVTVWRRDPGDWWPEEDRALYVRDLMVAPRFRHQGVGATVLRWAERFAAGLGSQRVRLDCLASNERICRYYKEAGYRPIGTDNSDIAYFEKALT